MPPIAVDYNLANVQGEHAYNSGTAITSSSALDNVYAKMSPLLSRAENEIQSILDELNTKEPGELDQSRLMYAQMASTRWQMAFQLGSNFISAIATGLKTPIQNLRG
jgi:5-hydroxyisourate hydrolase-like protein (transthyretin family)